MKSVEENMKNMKNMENMKYDENMKYEKYETYIVKNMKSDNMIESDKSNTYTETKESLYGLLMEKRIPVIHCLRIHKPDILRSPARRKNDIFKFRHQPPAPLSPANISITKYLLKSKSFLQPIKFPVPGQNYMPDIMYDRKPDAFD